MKAIADTMGVARSHLVKRLKPKTQPARSRYNKADGLAVAFDPRTCGLRGDLRVQKDLCAA